MRKKNKNLDYKYLKKVDFDAKKNFTKIYLKKFNEICINKS